MTGDDEYKKYDLDNANNFDSELIERKTRKRHEEGYQKREEKRSDRHYKQHQRVLNKCNQCYFNETRFLQDYVIAESDTVYVAFPSSISPLHPQDKEPLTHLVISPKSHFANFVEIDEQIQTELRNFQKSIVAFYLECFGMQTVFLETSIQSDHFIPHAQMECVGFINDDTDMEVFFKKSLQDDDSEWGTHKKIIDTKARKGMIWRCMPSTGQFNYVHIDFNGLGGFAHVIEDSKKFGKTKALEVLGGAMGHDFVNLSIPFRKEKAEKYVKDIRQRFKKYDWTRYGGSKK
ncbi:hypothetical protein FGO68_gene12107 [Halteria grandinella]|uniref:CWF19-like protein 2 n=1 Tax=Halteria grandinella TaxID=5974 RepID=A0A8J8NQH8_HALGN|nr:hypothetical protein FGO68_gene12107 [Halteria grandinella]